MVAGAGSVKSSAGNKSACTEVTELFLVRWMRSCNSPISGSQGWADSLRRWACGPGERTQIGLRETKMLSMKRSVSGASASRKYSATVSPVSATRRRAPGGSVIWR